MFKIPDIPNSTKDLVGSVMSGATLVTNIFDTEYANYSVISATCTTMAIGLEASLDADRPWSYTTKTRLLQVLNAGISPFVTSGGDIVVAEPNESGAREIPYGSNNWYKQVEPGTGTHALPAGYSFELDSLPDIWSKNMKNSAATVADIATNMATVRYATVIDQALGYGSKAVNCAPFLEESLATVSENLFNVAQNVDTLMIEFSIKAAPLQGRVPDTPEEELMFDECGYLAQNIIDAAQAFGREVNAMQSLQDETREKLINKVDAFNKVGAILGYVNDPCVQSLLSVYGSDELREATGIADKASGLLDSLSWSNFKKYFGI